MSRKKLKANMEGEMKFQKVDVFPCFYPIHTYLFFPEQVKLLRVVSTLAKTYLIKVINIFH